VNTYNKQGNKDSDKNSSKSTGTNSGKNDNEDKVKKSKPREFADALIYAGIVAFIIKILLFEAFRIPTGSMEKTLWVGDFLLVTKFTYGATTPRNIPFTDIRIPYLKLPGFKDPKKGDIIVFDFLIIWYRQYSVYGGCHHFHQSSGFKKIIPGKRYIPAIPSEYLIPSVSV